jgi:hypothetical protein
LYDYKANSLVFLGLRVFLGSLLGEEDLVNVGENTTAGNGNVTEKLVQLFIVANGQLEMTGRNGLLLVVSSSISGQLKDFSSQVLQDGSEVDGGTGTNTLSIVALAEETMDTTNGELESSLIRARRGLA